MSGKVAVSALFKCSYTSAARYVAELRRTLRREDASGPGTMKLVWNPGEAQADFGEADFVVSGCKSQ